MDEREKLDGTTKGVLITGLVVVVVVVLVALAALMLLGVGG